MRRATRLPVSPAPDVLRMLAVTFIPGLRVLVAQAVLEMR